MPRKRGTQSIKQELMNKSREAVLAAVQIYNNPHITFKSESFIVLMMIGWTYLLHAYYRKNNIEYRYYKLKGSRKKYDRTKKGAYKYWELEQCIVSHSSPLDKDTVHNLMFIIGIRHEIEHQMTNKIDDYMSAKFQACCLNYNDYLKRFFGEQYGIEKELTFSLQFSSISVEQKELLLEVKNLPKNIQSFIQDFNDSLSVEEYQSERFAYRVLFVEKIANSKSQADNVIEFVKGNSELGAKINKTIVIKETERKKYFPKQIVSLMHAEGFNSFSLYVHTRLWKDTDAKNRSKGYGTIVGNRDWMWYENWVDYVREFCRLKNLK